MWRIIYLNCICCWHEYDNMMMPLVTFFDLFAYSYLNYGLNAVRAEILKITGQRGNPCIINGYHGTYVNTYINKRLAGDLNYNDWSTIYPKWWWRGIRVLGRGLPSVTSSNWHEHAEVPRRNKKGAESWCQLSIQELHLQWNLERWRWRWTEESLCRLIFLRHCYLGTYTYYSDNIISEIVPKSGNILLPL